MRHLKFSISLWLRDESSYWIESLFSNISRKLYIIWIRSNGRSQKSSYILSSKDQMMLFFLNFYLFISG